MKKTLKVLGLFLFVSLALTSCSSDDGGTSGSANIFDKWWYSADHSTTDVRFNSDGTYQSTYTSNGLTINSNGQWEWSDEAAKEMHIFNTTGNGLSEWHFKFNNIAAHSLKLRMSMDDGATWGETPSSFVDEQPAD